MPPAGDVAKGDCELVGDVTQHARRGQHTSYGVAFGCELACSSQERVTIGIGKDCHHCVLTSTFRSVATAKRYDHAVLNGKLRRASRLYQDTRTANVHSLKPAVSTVIVLEASTDVPRAKVTPMMLCAQSNNSPVPVLKNVSTENEKPQP